MLADMICYCKMTSFMPLDVETSYLSLNHITNRGKGMQHSLSIGRSSSVQWRKVGRN